MIKLNKILGMIFIGFTSSFLFSQDSTVVSDFEMWTGIHLKKSFLEKKLEIGLTEEFRFDDNSTHLNNFFTELNGSYELFKGFNVGLAYRFIKNRKNSGDINEQRINADLEYKHKVERFKLQYRFRYQNRNEIGLSRDEGDYATNKYRLRIKATYDIKGWKLDPYISAEGFYATETYQYNYIESIDEIDEYSGFEKLRFTLGTKYQVKKWFDIGAYYRIEHELKSYPGAYNTPKTFYIGGVQLKFNL